jgi:hypothetical protein
MDKSFGNAQSQTCSVHFTVVSSVAIDKVIENAVSQIVGNARNGVLNLEHHLVAVPANGQRVVAPFGEFDCIADQVHQDVLQVVAVRGDPMLRGPVPGLVKCLFLGGGLAGMVLRHVEHI